MTEVSPRDGLQNEPRVISTPEKVRLASALAGCGVEEVEVSSFVSPRWIPQLGDATEVFDGLARGGVDIAPGAPWLSALVPNERGLASALAVNERWGRRVIRKVSVFTAASETFCRKNINATIAESIERFVPVVAGARSAGLVVRGYVSCVIACPFEGAIDPAAVARVAGMLRGIGVDELDLGDTIGAGDAASTERVLAAVDLEWPITGVGEVDFAGGRGMVTLHLHDTFGRAVECVRAGLAAGVRSFDASAAGLGGCPYAGREGKRAPGNIDTGALVREIRRAGYAVGVDGPRLEDAASLARSLVAGAGGGEAVAR